MTAGHITPLPRHTQPRTPHYAILLSQHTNCTPRGLGSARQNACPPAEMSSGKPVLPTSSYGQPQPKLLPPPPLTVCRFSFTIFTLSLFASAKPFLKPFETIPQAHSPAWCPSPHLITAVRLHSCLLQRDLSEYCGSFACTGQSPPKEAKICNLPCLPHTPSTHSKPHAPDNYALPLLRPITRWSPRPPTVCGRYRLSSL